jgi:hypothetical protein
MAQATLSAEVVISVIFGILQLIVGLVSLWLQHRLHWVTRKWLSRPAIIKTNIVVAFRLERRRSTF